jgi:hypothetical protein
VFLKMLVPSQLEVEKEKERAFPRPVRDQVSDGAGLMSGLLRAPLRKGSARAAAPATNAAGARPDGGAGMGVGKNSPQAQKDPALKAQFEKVARLNQALASLPH